MNSQQMLANMFLKNKKTTETNKLMVAIQLSICKFRHEVCNVQKYQGSIFENPLETTIGFLQCSFKERACYSCHQTLPLVILFILLLIISRAYVAHVNIEIC